MLLNNIRAFGYPKIEVMVGVSATIINIVFNVIFTFVLDMGMKGIASVSYTHLDVYKRQDLELI